MPLNVLCYSRISTAVYNTVYIPKAPTGILSNDLSIHCVVNKTETRLLAVILLPNPMVVPTYCIHNSTVRVQYFRTCKVRSRPHWKCIPPRGTRGNGLHSSRILPLNNKNLRRTPSCYIHKHFHNISVSNSVKKHLLITQ